VRPTLYTQEEAARLALLSGEAVEMIRFVVAALDGEVRIVPLTSLDLIYRPFVIDVIRAGERHLPELKQYADRDRLFFEIPITAMQTDGCGWYWQATTDIFDSIKVLCGPEVQRIARTLADEILPIVIAAGDAGVFS
jgi:hypothetical protein